MSAGTVCPSDSTTAGAPAAAGPNALSFVGARWAMVRAWSCPCEKEVCVLEEARREWGTVADPCAAGVLCEAGEEGVEDPAGRLTDAGADAGDEGGEGPEEVLFSVRLDWDCLLGPPCCFSWSECLWSKFPWPWLCPSI